MNYSDYKKWAQDKFNALPIHYAFGQKQFDEMLKKHFNNISVEDAAQQLYSTAAGGYYYRSDSKKIDDTIKEIENKLNELIKADTTGDGFIYEMFYYELANHEYVISGSLAETLDALNMTIEEIKADPALLHGLKKAKAAIIEEYENAE